MMNYEKEAIDNLNYVIWIGSILIAAFAPLIPIRNRVDNALLTNKTRYSIFKIVFCVIIHNTLITQNNELISEIQSLKELSRTIYLESVSVNSSNNKGQMVVVALLTF